jgi:predicted  nucleic acid-binding Zn-ribbon protein
MDDIIAGYKRVPSCADSFVTLKEEPVVDVAKLYELQKTDLTWEKVRRRLVQLRNLLAESDELKQQRKIVADLEAEQQQWQTKQRNEELEAQSLALRIKSSEERLMSGQVRNPKELESLQASVAALRRQRDAVETSGVEALLKQEEITALLAQARATLQQVEEKWKSSQAELLQEETKLKRAFVQLKKQREALATVLAGEQLQRYEDLRQRKAGIAVAAVERGLCGACHVQVPTGVASAARSQVGAPVLCPSCGRMLYAGGSS